MKEQLPENMSGSEKETINGSESIDWSQLELLRGEFKEIFASFDRKFEEIKIMTEIAQDRQITMPPEAEVHMQEVIKKFQPYGGNPGILYNMLDELGSISSTMYQNGLLVDTDDYKKMKEELSQKQ